MRFINLRFGIVDCGDAIGGRGRLRPADRADAGAARLPVRRARLAADQLDRALRGGRLAARHPSGCRMWDWHPDPKDRGVWSGICPGGKKEGRGVVQWFEHGQAIDRFEGTYPQQQARRLRPLQLDGRDQLRRRLPNDVPNGFGTAKAAGRELRRRLEERLLHQGQPAWWRSASSAQLLRRLSPPRSSARARRLSSAYFTP